MSVINEKNVRYVVDEPAFVEPYTEDPMEIGVRKAMAKQSMDHPEWLDMAPRKGKLRIISERSASDLLLGYLPLAIALLTIIDNEEGKRTLDLIYAEAVRRKKDKVVRAYEQAGSGGLSV